jgi:hypothetical protein
MEAIMADFTAADAALASLQSTAAEVVTAFQAATANNDQPSVDSLTSGIQGVQTQLAELVPPPPSPAPGPFAIANTSVSLSVGVADTVNLDVSGGTPPYSASGLPAGVTFDATDNALVADTTTTVGTSSVTISDSASPANTGTVTVTIA